MVMNERMMCLKIMIFIIPKGQGENTSGVDDHVTAHVLRLISLLRNFFSFFFLQKNNKLLKIKKKTKKNKRGMGKEI